MARVLSGMRPTGPLHLGHLLGALENWKKLQDEGHECFFMIADLHALMGEYENPSDIESHTHQMILDWTACGIKPENIFIQSLIPEHAELALLLGMITPLSWLERNPTYKEQLREIAGRDLTTYGFLGYPVLQAADILLYRADKVPVGEDQLAHLELTREIVRRFKHLYHTDIFPEPKPILTEQPKILGTDRRKMSKSYGNAINLSDDPQTLRKKAQSMITDPARIKNTDPGHPDVCNVYTYYKKFAAESTVTQVYDWCTSAKRGCKDCKGIFADILDDYLKPIREKLEEVRGESPSAHSVLIERLGKGRERAQREAQETLIRVRDLIGLWTGTERQDPFAPSS